MSPAVRNHRRCAQSSMVIRMRTALALARSRAGAGAGTKSRASRKTPSRSALRAALDSAGARLRAVFKPLATGAAKRGSKRSKPANWRALVRSVGARLAAVTRRLA